MKNKVIITILSIASFGFLMSCDEEMAKYTFPHKPHFEQEIDCESCHELADNGSMQMPVFDTCLICHDGQPEVFSSCDQCHSDPKTLELDGDAVMSHQELFASHIDPVWSDVAMDHEKYIDMGQKACLECHKNVEHTTHSSLANLPTMDETMVFHDNNELSNDCQACHLELNKLTEPDSHDLGWMRNHGMSKEFGNMQSCLICHEQETCTSCHQTQKPRNHTNMWRRQTHGIQAAFNRESCLECHRNDECTTCHIAAAAPVPGTQFHTPDSDCMACHSPMGAPRPSNRFLKPMPHRMMMGMTSQKCLQCHMM